MQALATNLLESRKTVVFLDLQSARASLVSVTNGGAHDGSWIHPRLAVDLGRWLMPALAVFLDGWILESLQLSSCETLTSSQSTLSGPVIFRLPPPPVVMETCPSGCLDEGPPHFYILRIPSQPGAPEDGDTYRGGRTKDFDARMLKHRLTYGDGLTEK